MTSRKPAMPLKLALPPRNLLCLAFRNCSTSPNTPPRYWEVRRSHKSGSPRRFDDRFAVTLEVHRFAIAGEVVRFAVTREVDSAVAPSPPRFHFATRAHRSRRRPKHFLLPYGSRHSLSGPRALFRAYALGG